MQEKFLQEEVLCKAASKEKLSGYMLVGFNQLFSGCHLTKIGDFIISSLAYIHGDEGVEMHFFYGWVSGVPHIWFE